MRCLYSLYSSTDFISTELKNNSKQDCKLLSFGITISLLHLLLLFFYNKKLLYFSNKSWSKNLEWNKTISRT